MRNEYACNFRKNNVYNIAFPFPIMLHTHIYHTKLSSLSLLAREKRESRYVFRHTRTHTHTHTHTYPRLPSLPLIYMLITYYTYIYIYFSFYCIYTHTHADTFRLSPKFCVVLPHAVYIYYRESCELLLASKRKINASPNTAVRSPMFYLLVRSLARPLRAEFDHVCVQCTLAKVVGNT